MTDRASAPPAPDRLERPSSGRDSRRSGLGVFRQRLKGVGIRSVAIVTAGNGASAALAIVASWIVATRLAPAEFGLFSLAFAIMTLVQEVAGPALDTAIVRFAAAHSGADPLRAEAFLRAGFRMKLGVSALLAAGMALLAGLLADHVYQEPQLRPLIYWMAAAMVAANLSTFVLARLQAAERFASYFVFRALANGLKVLFLALAWIAGWFDLEIVSAVWTLSFVLTWLIGSAACRPPAGEPRSLPGDRPYRTIAGFAQWVMLSGLFFAAHMRADVLLLGHFRPAEDVGYYSIAWNLMLFMDLVTSSVLVAFLPKASKVRTPGEIAHFRWTAFAASSLVALALSPLYFLADPMIATFFPNYLPAIAPFYVLFWSSIIVLLVYPLYLSFYAENKPARLTIAYGILALASFALGYFIIPIHGLIGAAYTTFLARVIGAGVILLFLLADRRRGARDG